MAFRHIPNRIALFGLVTAVVVLVAPADGAAHPGYLTTWSAEYPASTSDTAASCELCHGGSNSTWNPYGWQIRLGLHGGAALLDAIRAAEAYDSDGDPGGFTNLQEILANTQPGWTPGPNNTIYAADASFTTGNLPDSGVSGSLDPAPGTTTSSSTTSSTSTTSTSSTSTSSSSSSTTSTSIPGSTTSTSSSTSSSTTSSSSSTSSSVPGSSTSTSTSVSTSTTTSATSSSTSTTFVSSTTATTTVSSTTTTTAPPAELLSGKKLLLADHPAKPQKHKLTMVSKDAAITLGAGNGSADDPTIAGGTLRVVASGGDGFDATYALPASAWTRIGKEGAGKGYKLKKAAPITSIEVKTGKVIKVVGKGSDLQQSLASEPETVSVVLTLGELRYCLTFGTVPGTVDFKPGKKYLAKNSPAPVSCPAADSPAGAFVE